MSKRGTSSAVVVDGNDQVRWSLVTMILYARRSTITSEKKSSVVGPVALTLIGQYASALTL